MKIFTLASYFYRKNKSSIISFGIIILISTILFTSSLVIFKNITNDYNEKYQNLNTPDMFFIIPEESLNERILNLIRENKNVKSVTTKEGVSLNANIEFDGLTQDESFIFYDLKDLDYYEVVHDAGGNDGIYLANYSYIHGSKGETFEFKLPNKTYEYKINKVINEMLQGMHTGAISQYLSSNEYNKLKNDNIENLIISIQVKADDAPKVYNEISKILASNNISVLSSSSKNSLTHYCLAIVYIIIGVLIIFSSIILIISLLVCKFKIKQSIYEEIVNMGIIKSLGYKSSEIIIAVIIPYLMLGFLFSSIGLLLSPFAAKAIGKSVEIQSGFIWDFKHDFSIYFITFFINLLLILLFTYLSSKKIKKINAINAIRNININSSNKNYFPVEVTKGNINIILSLKGFINNISQNILLGLVIFLVTIVLSFVSILFYNANIKTENFVDTLVEEHPSAIVTFASDHKDEIAKMADVRKVMYYGIINNIFYNEDTYTMFVTNNYNLIENNLCYKGRNPQEASEIAIGSDMQQKYNLNIGDYITLEKNNNKYTYEIVGFIQSVNYQGKIIELTTSGYHHLNENYQETDGHLYVYLNDETKAKKFIDDIKNNYSDVLATVNYYESMKSASVGILSVISIISIVVIIIAIILIYLILYIIISSIITKSKERLGIYKSLGYINRQLIIHMLGSFAPSVIIGTFIGTIISIIFMNNIFLLVFNSLSIYHITFSYPILIYLLVVLLVILSTLVIGIVETRKIRKISVYSLIKD